MTKDASQPWPEDRKVVDLGVLTLTEVVPNSLEVQKKLPLPAHEPHAGYRALRRSAADRAHVAAWRHRRSGRRSQ